MAAGRLSGPPRGTVKCRIRFGLERGNSTRDGAANLIEQRGVKHATAQSAKPGASVQENL
jgi:hypothetical protein